MVREAEASADEHAAGGRAKADAEEHAAVGEAEAVAEEHAAVGEAKADTEVHAVVGDAAVEAQDERDAIGEAGAGAARPPREQEGNDVVSMAGLLAVPGECGSRVVVDGSLATSRSPRTAVEELCA